MLSKNRSPWKSRTKATIPFNALRHSKGNNKRGDDRPKKGTLPGFWKRGPSPINKEIKMKKWHGDHYHCVSTRTLSLNTEQQRYFMSFLFFSRWGGNYKELGTRKPHVVFSTRFVTTYLDWNILYLSFGLESLIDLSSSLFFYFPWDICLDFVYF